jgi:signal recognition particle GTPase
VALLEADVSLPVARDFIKAVQEKATGAGGHQIGHAGPAGRQDRP